MNDCKCDIWSTGDETIVSLVIPHAYRADSKLATHADLMDILLLSIGTDRVVIGCRIWKSPKRDLQRPEIVEMLEAADIYGAKIVLKTVGLLGGVPPSSFGAWVAAADSLTVLPGVNSESARTWLETNLLRRLRSILDDSAMADIDRRGDRPWHPVRLRPLADGNDRSDH